MWFHVRMYVCTYVCMNVCIYMYVRIYLFTCVYVCVYVCMCAYPLPECGIKYPYVMYMPWRITLPIPCIPRALSSPDIQYRYLIPSPVDRTSASAWLYKNPWIISQRNKPSTSMTHVACESMLRSFVRSGTCGGIHTQKTGFNRVCGRVLCPGCPRI